MYSASTIANYFLHKSWLEGDPLSLMKLLKMVYIAHGWYLADTNKPLIGDRILAWPYGPIIPELYYQIRDFEDRPITSPINSAFYSVNEQVFDESLTEFLDTIWDHYKNFSALQLSALTHKDGSPWSLVAQNYPRKKLAKNSIIIPNEIIQHYYAQKVHAVEQGHAP